MMRNISTVAINNQMGTFQAIEYLVNMGHTDIGYVHTTEYISSWSERALGYRQALAQFWLPLSDDKVYRARYNGGNSYDDFVRSSLRVRSSPPRWLNDSRCAAFCEGARLQKQPPRYFISAAVCRFFYCPNCCAITSPISCASCACSAAVR